MKLKFLSQFYLHFVLFLIEKLQRDKEYAIIG